MSLGLTNAPSTIIRLTNHVLCNFIENFVVIYFNNILFYSKNLNENVDHKRQVLKVSGEAKLYPNLKKLYLLHLKFDPFGFVSDKGIVIAEEKVKEIIEWPKPNGMFGSQE